MTHARTAGRRGRGAVRAVGGPVMRTGLPGPPRFRARVQRLGRRVPQPLRAVRALRPRASCGGLLRARTASGREAAEAPRCEAEASRQRHKSAFTGLAQAWESNPRQTVYETVALPTELTRWRLETASSCGTRTRNSQRERARRNSRVRTADTIPVSDLCTTPPLWAKSNLFAGIPSPKRRDPDQQSQPGSLLRVPGGLR